MLPEDKNKIYYLASPYTHDDPNIINERYEKIEKVATVLLIEGYILYEPIVSNHHKSKKYELPSNFEFWKRSNDAFIEKCDGLIVCKLEGWENSKGVKNEIDIAKKLNKDIYYIDPK